MATGGLIIDLNGHAYSNPRPYPTSMSLMKRILSTTGGNRVRSVDILVLYIAPAVKYQGHLLSGQPQALNQWPRLLFIRSQGFPLHTVYHTGLKTSYIIEPKLGEANYAYAEEDPLDFYDELFIQPVTEHKVKKDKVAQKRIEDENRQLVARGLPKSKEVAPLVVKTEVTIRPFQKAMEKLRRKIAERLMKSVDFSTLDKLMDLLRIPAVEEEIKELVGQDRAQLQITILMHGRHLSESSPGLIIPDVDSVPSVYLVGQDKLQIVDQNDNVLYDKELKEGLGLNKKQPSASDSFFAKTSSPLKQTQPQGKRFVPPPQPYQRIKDIKSSVLNRSQVSTASSSGSPVVQLKVADQDFKKIESKIAMHLEPSENVEPSSAQV